VARAPLQAIQQITLTPTQGATGKAGFADGDFLVHRKSA